MTPQKSSLPEEETKENAKLIKKERKKGVKNPFEDGLLERLGRPFVSSPLFRRMIKVEEQPSNSNSPFSWSIDQQSHLYPVHFGTPEYKTPSPCPSEEERKIQTIIDKFFKEHLVVPSPLSTGPCSSATQNCNNESDAITPEEKICDGSPSSKPTNSPVSTPRIPEENHAWTQTYVKLPLNSTENLEESIQTCVSHLQTDADTSKECLSGRYFPRKLSFSPVPLTRESLVLSPISTSKVSQTDNSGMEDCESAEDERITDLKARLLLADTPEIVLYPKHAWTQTYLTLPPDCGDNLSEIIKPQLKNEIQHKDDESCRKRFPRKLKFSIERSPFCSRKAKLVNMDSTHCLSPAFSSSSPERQSRCSFIPSQVESPFLSPISFCVEKVSATNKKKEEADLGFKSFSHHLLSPQDDIKEEEERHDDTDEDIPVPLHHSSLFTELRCKDEGRHKMFEEDMKRLSSDESVCDMMWDDSCSAMDTFNRSDTGYETGFKSNLLETGLTQGLDSIHVYKDSKVSDVDVQDGKPLDFEHFTPPESSTPAAKKHVPGIQSGVDRCIEEIC